MDTDLFGDAAAREEVEGGADEVADTAAGRDEFDNAPILVEPSQEEPRVPRTEDIGAMAIEATDLAALHEQGKPGADKPRVVPAPRAYATLGRGVVAIPSPQHLLVIVRHFPPLSLSLSPALSLYRST